MLVTASPGGPAYPCAVSPVFGLSLIHIYAASKAPTTLLVRTAPQWTAARGVRGTAYGVGMADELEGAARAALRRLVGRDDADFHDGQLESVLALVRDRERVLVVQRTGWGKSAVYFVATTLLRAAGAGPTVIVSPLLSLMLSLIHI